MAGKVEDLEWVRERDIEQDILMSVVVDAGRITVLHRETGWGGGGIFDTETGFRDTGGSFWLASGDYDIREQGHLTIEEAIADIKKNANTCVGD